MLIDITQEQWGQILFQQAALWFGQERAEHLRPQLEEQATYFWLITQHLPSQEEEPDFVCSIAHRPQEI
jgi:hypothetical protein